MSQITVAIVGAGHAGGRVAQGLLQKGFSGRIVLIGEEPHAPYERPALSKELLLGSKQADELLLAPAEFWRAASNLTRLHGRVVELDALTRTLVLDTGEKVEFDQLVLATGGSPRRLDIAGGDLPGLHYLRTLDDGERLRQALASAESLLVIGAGVIGMEAAASAVRLGVRATVVEAGSRVMARCIPEGVSEWLTAQHGAAGVQLHLGARIDALNVQGNSYCLEGTTGDGQTLRLHADAVLVAVGIECETAFVERAGVRVDNGVLVDQFCRSVNTPWCYAVGDVARTFVPARGDYLRQETWRNAENQAQAVVELILGGDAAYAETPWMWTDQFDHNIQVVGVPQPDDQVVVRGDLGAGRATLVHVRDGRVVGGVMVNQARDRRSLEALVERGCEIDMARLADVSVPLKQVAA